MLAAASSELARLVVDASGLDKVFFDVAADLGADLDDRLMHLRLDRLVQRQLGLGKDLRGDVRAQIARLRINRLVFLFNPDAEAWPVHLLIP